MTRLCRFLDDVVGDKLLRSERGDELSSSRASIRALCADWFGPRTMFNVFWP